MKFAAWFKRRSRREEELDNEIRAHLEMAIRERMERGESKTAAEASARREFGNEPLIEETTRDTWGWRWLEALVQDIGYGIRQLRWNAGMTTVAILTLALGIGANTAIFSLIDAVMLRSLPVNKPEELVELRLYNPQRGGEGTQNITNPLWEQLRDRQDVFSGIFASGNEQFDLAQGGAVERADGLFVSGSYFETLGVHPAAGRLLANSDDVRGCPDITVLNYGFWQEHYGGSDSAIGQTISLNKHPFQIVGASAAGFFGTEVGSKFDIAIPVCTAKVFDEKEQRLDDRSWWWLGVMARVRPGTNRNQLKARLAALSPQMNEAALPLNWPEGAKRNFLKRTFVTRPAPSGISSLRRHFTEPLDILMVVVGLVLLIACANIASLMLARATSRQREIAVRQAMGASRVRLVRQLLTECVILSMAGALVGILFARWCSEFLVRYITTARDQVFLELSPDWRVLGFTAAIAVGTGLLFGALPALHSTRVSLMSAMKGRSEIGPLHFRSSKWIVAGQVGLSLVLLVSAGLLLRSFAKLATLDIGFDRNNVLLVNVNLGAAKIPDERKLEVYRQLEDRLRALPGVISASRSWNTPISHYQWDNNVQSDVPDPPIGDAADVYLKSISSSYFATLRSPILAGRGFDDRDSKASPLVAIINQTMARRFYPKVNPIGRSFKREGESGKPGTSIQVVGVVRDAKYDSIKEETYATAFFPIAQQTPGHDDEETYELRTAVRPSSVASAVQSSVAGENKGISLSFRTLAEQVNDSMVQERLLAVLSGFFGALALLLAMIGLYGTLSYLVAQRQTEFGIRMALGARSGLILRLVLRDLTAVLAGGVFGGILFSLAATRLLRQMLFSLDPRDPLTLFGAAAMLSVVALFAGYLPARRATKVDPMVALRYE